MSSGLKIKGTKDSNVSNPINQIDSGATAINLRSFFSGQTDLDLSKEEVIFYSISLCMECSQEIDNEQVSNQIINLPSALQKFF